MKTGTAESYKIVRRFRDHPEKRRVMARHLTLQEAQEWCSDPNTSSSTAWKTTPLKLTKRFGPWFDGYESE